MDLKATMLYAMAVCVLAFGVTVVGGVGVDNLFLAASGLAFLVGGTLLLGAYVAISLFEAYKHQQGMDEEEEVDEVIEAPTKPQSPPEPPQRSFVRPKRSFLQSMGGD